MASGQWKNPDDNTRSKDTLEYYQWMAKLAEKGKITSIFFADVYGGHEIFEGSMAPTFRSGSGVATLDPVVVVSAMAAVTKSVSFAITGSTSYISTFPGLFSVASKDLVADKTRTICHCENMEYS